MSEADHSTCNKVIADLEMKVREYDNFLESISDYADKLLPAHEKYAKVIRDTRDFLNKQHGTNNR